MRQEPLNLETRIDSDLHDYAVYPEDFRKAIVDLQTTLESSDAKGQIHTLGKIGSYQRILGFLREAEKSFERAIELSAALDLAALQLVNLIRLGHTRHWMNRFVEAHEIFDKCHGMIAKDALLGEWLDFVYQHQGKCYFDEKRYDLALKSFYQAILLRTNKSESELSDSSLLAIEVTKARCLPQVSPAEMKQILADDDLPPFVREVIGKKHGEGLPPARFNCIDAALSFHGLKCRDRLQPLKPIDLLHFLMEKTEQVYNFDDVHMGDLIVWWNRSGGSWDQREIKVKDMNLADADFPYGLIFDHVAVRVTREIVFNKPNPSPQSEYKFDYLETASYPSRLGEGHEMTLHRPKGSRYSAV